MANELPEVETNRGLLKPTVQITVFSVLGILLSFATEIIAAAIFGASTKRDSYFAAVVIPDYVTTVLLGSLTVTFIPIFIEYETRKNKAQAWKVASVFTNLMFLVLFGISLLGFIFAKRLISVTAPGFKGVELSLTTSLLRIILPSIIFSGLASLLSSIYYAEHRFIRPAIGPIINAVLMLICVVLLAPYWGIKSLAFGHLIGAVVGFFILVPILFKQDRYRFSWDFHNEGVTQIIKVMSPLVFAGIFYRATTVIERMIASTLPTGSISYLGYATKITTILGTIATMGISTTIFPLMARSWAENDLAKVRKYFAKGVRIIMLITFPITTVFVVLRVPIIQVVFERGAFDHRTTMAVANVLAILMVAFITSGLGNIVGKGFYIAQKTKVVAILGIIGILIYLSAAYFLSRTLSYVGLAIATSIQLTFGLIVSMYCMKRIYNGINGKKVIEGFVKISIASFISGGFIYFSFQIAALLNMSLILKTGIATFLGVLTFALVSLYVFKLEEALSMQQKLIERFRVSIISHRAREF
jgi:putative peptidoglycan lipid II flippase